VRARPVTEQIAGGCIKSRNLVGELLDVSLTTLVSNPSNPAVLRNAKRQTRHSRDQFLQFAKQLGLVSISATLAWALPFRLPSFETEFGLREEGAADEKQKLTSQADRSGLRGCEVDRPCGGACLVTRRIWAVTWGH
jgi:hypothetical protein